MMANQKSGLSSAENSDDESLDNEVISNTSGHSQINFDDEDGNEDIYSNNSENYEEGDEGEEDDNESGQYDDEDDEDDEEDDDESEVSQKKKKMSYEEIQQEKQKLLFNLDRLQKQGYPPSKKYSMASSFEDLTYEHED